MSITRGRRGWALGALRDGSRRPGVALAMAIGVVGLLLLPLPARADGVVEIDLGCEEVGGLIDAMGATAGPTVINLNADSQPSCTYTLTGPTTFLFGPLGLPVVERPITINGGGSTIVRSPTATEFGIFLVRGPGSLRLSNTTISGGLISDFLSQGGGIFNLAGGTVTLIDSTVSGNAADAGGGISNDRGTVTLIDSTVSGNAANSGGGIFNLVGGTVTLIDSTVSGNTAHFGGGIRNHGTVTLIDSTVSGNSAGTPAEGPWGVYEGGGIYNAGIVDLENSQVIENTAEANGGGILNQDLGVLTMRGGA